MKKTENNQNWDEKLGATTPALEIPGLPLNIVRSRSGAVPKPPLFFFVGETDETSSVKSHALTIRTGLRLSSACRPRNTSCREGIMSPVPGVGDSREVTQQKHAALQASIALQQRFQAAAVRPLRMENWARAFARGKKKLSRFSAPSTPDLGCQHDQASPTSFTREFGAGPLLSALDKNSTISVNCPVPCRPVGFQRRYEGGVDGKLSPKV